MTLERHGVDEIEDIVRDVTAVAGLSNVFNASVLLHHGVFHVAVRAESFPGEKPFRAYLIAAHSGSAPTLTDLTAATAARGIAKTADPKLLLIDDELFVTFNTGNVHTGYNDIYLQQVTPKLGPPQRCVLEPRRMVEKNWGFYKLSPQDPLRAVYSLNPLMLLEHKSGALGTEDDLVFSASAEADVSRRFPRLHLGSQPFHVGNGRALVAANQQRPIPGLPRKLYFGRIAELDLNAGIFRRLSPKALVHSWSAMLPQRRTHNPGLLSATYFAGLTELDGNLLLSYGRNDTHLGVARVPESCVWR